tara:strand:- start:16575 stop:18062 length:1488 start_codon:yes stop_codon:yes gene_type:complete
LIETLNILFVLLIGYSIVTQIIPGVGIMERICLSYGVAIGFNSLFMFVVLLLKIPVTSFLISLSYAVILIFLFFYFKENILNPDSWIFERIKKKYLFMLLSFLGTLFILSVIISVFYPITTADGIWYEYYGKIIASESNIYQKILIIYKKPLFLPITYAFLYLNNIFAIQIIFPLFYLFLCLAFFFRLSCYTADLKLVSIFSIVLATTPYIWWHSYLPLLNLIAGYFFSIGIFCWYSSLFPAHKQSLQTSKGFMLLAGIFFGFSSWARLEFIWYFMIPVFLYFFYSASRQNKDIDKFRLLLLPTVGIFLPWIIYIGVMKAYGEKEFAMFLTLYASLIVIYIVYARLNSNAVLIKAVILLTIAAILIVSLLFLWDINWMFIFKRLQTTLAKTVVNHFFYFFTFFLIFLFKAFKNNIALKYLSCFIGLYLIWHFALYNVGGGRWEHWYEYFTAIFSEPGNFVSGSSTRELLAFYPVFIFWIAVLNNGKYVKESKQKT